MNDESKVFDNSSFTEKVKKLRNKASKKPGLETRHTKKCAVPFCPTRGRVIHGIDF